MFRLINSSQIRRLSTTRCRLKEESSFVLNTFAGKIQPEEVFPYPDISEFEKSEVRAKAVKILVEFNDAIKNDRSSSVPKDVMEKLRDLGLYSMLMPRENRGLNLKYSECARIYESIGENDMSIAFTLLSNQAYCAVKHFGNEAQKARYLRNDGRYALCLTEPESGSHLDLVKSTAVLKDGHYVLNGMKAWVVNADLAELFVVFANTKEKTLSAFVVEKQFDGVNVGAADNKIGLRAARTMPLQLENVKVPKENLLGKEGDGLKVAMQVININRLGLSACLLGVMSRCINQSASYAVHHDYGISKYQSVQEKIAIMASLHYTSESMVYLLANNMDKSESFKVESAICKYFASEVAYKICDKSIQLMGGKALMTSTDLERIFRDLRVFRIVGVNNDALKLFVSMKGLKFITKEIDILEQALKKPTSNPSIVGQAFTKRFNAMMGKVPSNNFSKFIHKDLEQAANLMSRALTVHSITNEHVLLTYKDKIMHEQCILSRLADSAMSLYTGAVVLSRASRALEFNSKDAKLQTLLAQNYCWEAFKMILHRMNCVHMELVEKRYKDFTDITEIICSRQK